MPNHPLWLLSAEAHSVSCKLFDLVKASNKFKTLFKQCQMQRGEAYRKEVNLLLLQTDQCIGGKAN